MTEDDKLWLWVGSVAAVWTAIVYAALISAQSAGERLREERRAGRMLARPQALPGVKTPGACS